MRKKSTRRKDRKRSLLSPKWIVLLLGLFICLILFYLLLATPCANSESCINNLSGSYETGQTKAEFMGSVIPVPEERYDNLSQRVLGDTSEKNKRIEIDLTNQKLYAFEENTLIYEFPISSGKWGRTPTGDFRIWIKLRYTRMSGGSRALGTYYNLPNVPYTMFFYNDKIPKSRGFGIHGAYWHNNFGHPMSHGCINMRETDVEKLYHWAHPVSTTHTTYASEDDPGTPIKIYGEAPYE